MHANEATLATTIIAVPPEGATLDFHAFDAAWAATLRHLPQKAVSAATVGEYRRHHAMLNERRIAQERQLAAVGRVVQASLAMGLRREENVVPALRRAALWT